MLPLRISEMAGLQVLSHVPRMMCSGLSVCAYASTELRDIKSTQSVYSRRICLFVTPESTNQVMVYSMWSHILQATAVDDKEL
jgi:hypothetical protein